MQERPWYVRPGGRRFPICIIPIYDLAHAPQEMVNHFDDPGYAKTRKELEDMMRARPGKILAQFPKPIGMA